jgi:hypothetical protein
MGSSFCISNATKRFAQPIWDFSPPDTRCLCTGWVQGMLTLPPPSELEAAAPDGVCIVVRIDTER